ncbi:sensor histidine kinase [Streptomyces sp. GQFP]|uniref:sensor histidine kinase n=1 Tax=Streptomyces sp. GQFP TaxID=2907545 RepID=UPI001F439F3D|nr:histidine kinase [Streptomyces sp. GQFP]UIX32313.1 histidine kinase [Streptomyces sp. GQFP]
MRQLIRTGILGSEAPLLVVAACTVTLSLASLWWTAATVLLACAAGRQPGLARTAAVVLSAVVAVGVVAVAVVPSWITLGDRFVSVLVGTAVLPWFAGRFWRQYRALVRAGWERAEHLEREQQLVAEQARLRERARIAQDMHDLLGHDLSLIALSAGAMKLAPGLPDEQREAAGDIRARAATAVDRLGEIIGILRGNDAVTSAARVEDLVEGASAAGLPVTLATEGEPGELSPAAERAVHRVVQESLTNAAKHAPGAAVAVRIRHTADETEVRAENGPAPTMSGAAQGGGRGLVGLDERVRLAGGSMAYGPHEGGFAVVARIPRSPGSAMPQAAPAARDRQEVPQEHRRERQRLGRVARAAVWVPLAAVILLGAGLRAWDLFLVRASVLAPDAYARIHVGQDRTELAAVLPDRQTPHRPADNGSASSGMRCEYYAMTAHPFDDDSGDAYRLCFRANGLVLKQVVSQ